jgi:peptidoglycan/xylan/chitin deacetylase (PgdA/CDA1 family)
MMVGLPQEIARAGLMVDGAGGRVASMRMKTAMIKAAMNGLYHTGTHRLFAPYTQGSGMIFTLHHVRPEPPRPTSFVPHRFLEVTPEFLEGVLDQVQEAGVDVVSLDEAVHRLQEGDDRRFASFTFDDGYRDNLEYAYPLFKRRALPMTIYVPTDYPGGGGELWWLALEQVIARASEIELCRDGALWRLKTSTEAEKTRAFHEVCRWLHRLDQPTQRRVVRELAERYEIDMVEDCRNLVMEWDEVRTLAADPLVTIGAHTKGHFAVAKLPEQRALDEMIGSADRIEQELGTRPQHFSFPYGDSESAGPRDFALARQAGFKTAVTTRKGMLFPEHRRHLTALPRVSLHGEYQSLAYTAVYLSGAPFALWNRFQQVNAA